MYLLLKCELGNSRRSPVVELLPDKLCTILQISGWNHLRCRPIQFKFVLLKKFRAKFGRTVLHYVRFIDSQVAMLLQCLTCLQ